MASEKIGSFRDVGEPSLKKLLPATLYDSLFLNQTSDENLGSKSVSREAHLNYAAFGMGQEDCVALALSLKKFSEEHPEVWYDQLLMPLLRRSYEKTAEFFGIEDASRGICLVPNCTLGMKSVLQKLTINSAERLT